MPKPSPQQAAAWRGFLDTHARLASQIEATLQRSGLSLSEYRTLLLAEEAGGEGIAMGLIADRLGMSYSGFTRLASRLISDRCLDECRCPEDGRVRLISITKQGQQLLNQARQEYYQDIDQLFIDHLSGQEIDQLTEIWQKLANQ